MDVVATGGFAPYNRLIGFEFHEADGTVSLHGFPVAIVVVGFGIGGLHFTQGGVSVNFTEFLCRRCRVRLSIWGLKVLIPLTELRKASWYWRSAGALRALRRT